MVCQCKVRWHPLFLPGWAVEVVKRHMGYQILEARLATEDEVQQDPQIVPECCASNWHTITDTSMPTDGQDDSIMCHVCWRPYHMQCLQGESLQTATEAIADEKAQWTCQECQNLQYTPISLPQTLRYFRVTIAPRTELYDHLKADESFQQAYIAYMQRTKAGQGNGHHNDHEQKLKEQGDAYPSHNQRYDITMGQVQRCLLITETMPQDPHTDILPTGKHEVFVRKLERGPADDIKNIHRACVYTPDGRCRYMLHVDRAAQLWHRYLWYLGSVTRLLQNRPWQRQ
jgi:hypothetical protein